MTNLNEMKSKELKEMAKSLGVKNWWNLKKSELINEITFAMEDQDTQNDTQDAEEAVVEEVIAETEEAAQNEPETTEKNNGWEKIAKQQITDAYNWIVGENENSVTDGHMTQEELEEWVKNEGVETVYHEAITTEYGEGYCGGKAPSEMRFAGKKYCMALIVDLFKADGYDVEKPKQSKDMITYNDKTQNLSQWAKELGIPGQTLYARLHISNWPVEKAFTTPIKKRKTK